MICCFRQNIQTNEKELNKIIKYIQEFEPAGVAARDLQECLLLQLRKKEKSKSTQMQAIKIIETYFDEFTKKHYEKIQRALVLNDEDLKEVILNHYQVKPQTRWRAFFYHQQT